MNFLDARLPVSFWDRIAPEPNSGCWLWLGIISNKGYGLFRTSGRLGPRVGAHRVAYQALVAPIADGLVIDHLCRTRCCVNPAHLEPVTNAVNVLRGVGITARQARNTHCPRGHLFGPRDERLGQRVCHECANICKRARAAERRDHDATQHVARAVSL